MPRDVIISQTYSPAPCSAQSWRNAALVTPAIGASTTGLGTSRSPNRSVRGNVAVVMPPLSQPPRFASSCTVFEQRFGAEARKSGSGQWQRLLWGPGDGVG